MTERRPHWDDDLLTAVHAAVANDHFYFTTDQVYDVIAAVEDWQSRNAIRLVSDLQSRLMQREATIQAVRGIERRERCTSRDDEHYNDGWNDALAAVERALDGAS